MTEFFGVENKIEKKNSIKPFILKMRGGDMPPLEQILLMPSREQLAA